MTGDGTDDAPAGAPGGCGSRHEQRTQAAEEEASFQLFVFLIMEYCRAILQSLLASFPIVFV